MPTPDLKILRDLYAHDSAEWKPIRDEGTEDMRYISGDPWAPGDRRLRESANRPVLSADELGQYTNQIVNDIRMNKRAVKFSPVGNGANDKTAQFYADKWREIEYRSRAQTAYTTAFQNAVERSYGFVRVSYRYSHSRAINPDIWVDEVANPNLITPDCEATKADLSDMKHCWVREAWDHDSYDRRFKKPRQRSIKTSLRDLQRDAPEWVNDTHVFVGEHWKIETKRRPLHIYQDAKGQPFAFFEDEADKYAAALQGAQPLMTREVDDPTVIQQITNGVDILEETTWPGRYIPIVGCFGKVIYVEDTGKQKRQILSAIRLARDPQMLYAYLVTCEAEVIGAMPRFPYFVYKGQLSKTELENLVKSVHEPVAVIQVEPTIEGLPPGNGPLGFPQRNPYEPPLAAIEIAKEAARRAIQAAMGQSPLPTSAQRRNEKSGVALKHIEEVGQRGSFHFTDHYLDMIQRVGVIGEDLMDKIYDSEREVAVRKQNDTTEKVWINSPSRPDSIATIGDHLVTVSTGPSFDSEREQASDFADTLVGSRAMEIVGPEKAPKLLAQAVKLKNLGPIGDEIAEIIDPSLGADGEMSPEQAKQMLGQLQAENEQLKQVVQQAQQAIQGKVVESQTKLHVTQVQEAAENQRNREDNETKLAVAALSAQVERLTLFLEERARLGAQGHDVGMSHLEHQQALDQASQQHQSAVALSAQSAAQQPTEGA